MKRITTLSVALVAVLNAGAQTTINQSSYASWTPGIDTFRGVSQYNATPMANGNWDLTAATYATYYTSSKLPVTNPSFPQATFIIPSFYSFSAFQYSSDIAYGITAQGVQRFGETMGRQAYSLGAMTMNNMDSLVFLAQTVNYTAPRTMLAFPATANSNWTGTYSFNTNFELTVAAYSLNHVPGYRRTNVTTMDTVKGWGTMQVKMINGQNSSPMNVLAVKTHIQVIDSFFLGGNPAPAQLLTAFGLAQGQAVHTYRIAYYRSGEVEPLLVENYTDNTYATKSASSVHQNRLTSATAVTDISGISAISIYPNPVTNGSITLSLPNEMGSSMLAYEMTDAMGRIVAAGQPQHNGAKATIATGDVAAGTYYLRIMQNGKPVAAQKLIIR